MNVLARYSYIIMAALSASATAIFAQPSCQVPLSPVLRSVSVNPDNGFTSLQWTPSPSSGIAGYIIYTFKDNTGMVLDTIWNPGATSYTYSSTASKYFSVSYVVASHRVPDCTSPLSNPISSIFCSTEIDTCKKELEITWNHYTDFPVKVESYKIIYSVNGGTYSEINGIPRSSSSYILNDFITDTEYCFVVKAVLEGGGESVSNKSCILTKMQKPPAWINADNSTVSADGKITLTFSIDPSSQINQYRLERKTGHGGLFSVIAQAVSNGNKVQYTDSGADAMAINYYRLSAINNCNLPVTTSNISSNIVLEMEVTGSTINFGWNLYRQWQGVITDQRLYFNPGSGYSEYTGLNSADTTFSLDYRDIMYQVSGTGFCFYLATKEGLNPYGVSGRSISSTVCLPPFENITVPNIFSPNDDNLNDTFKPVLSFTPATYQFIITDRNGKVLMRTKTPTDEWDGKVDGIPVQQGVYLWFLDLVTPSGRSVSRTGTITVLTDN